MVRIVNNIAGTAICFFVSATNFFLCSGFAGRNGNRRNQRVQNILKNWKTWRKREIDRYSYEEMNEILRLGYSSKC